MTHSRMRSFNFHIFLCICLHDNRATFCSCLSHSNFHSEWNFILISCKLKMILIPDWKSQIVMPNFGGQMRCIMGNVEVAYFAPSLSVLIIQKVGTTFTKTTSFLSAHFLYDKMLRPECERSRVSFHSSNNNYCYIISKCTISLTKRRYRIKYESV